ncbi:MAG: hypothetical protein AB1390_03440 [Nitrospirota bacterium]
MRKKFRLITRRLGIIDRAADVGYGSLLMSLRIVSVTGRLVNNNKDKNAWNEVPHYPHVPGF